MMVAWGQVYLGVWVLGVALLAALFSFGVILPTVVSPLTALMIGVCGGFSSLIAGIIVVVSSQKELED